MTTIRLGETSLDRRGRSGWRDLLPREHGVWAWLALPLVLAVSLAPAWSTLAGALSVVAGFAGAEGFGRALSGSRAARGPTLVMVLFAQLCGALAVVSAHRPGVLVATLLGAGLVGFLAMAYLRGRALRKPLFEVLAIIGFVAIGAGLATSGGAAIEPTISGAVALGAWLVLGLWWIKATLAKVLSHREPWSEGRWFVGCAVALSLASGLATGRPWVGALPLLYGLRITSQRPPRVARDAKRVGLAELAWGIGLALAAGLL